MPQDAHVSQTSAPVPPVTTSGPCSGEQDISDLLAGVRIQHLYRGLSSSTTAAWKDIGKASAISTVTKTFSLHLPRLRPHQLADRRRKMAAATVFDLPNGSNTKTC
jgi:hypothetical protein